MQARGAQCFGDLGQRHCIEQSDLAICHQETPVALPGGAFS
jgi:poly-gamma-glutamate synthesis protein (capsule biosynthesis protein)